MPAHLSTSLPAPALYPALQWRPEIAESWRRCRAAGLDSDTRPDADLLPHAELHQRRAAAEPLLETARPMLQALHAQLSRGAQVVLLCDADGLILDALGELAFLRDAERLALRPGACWSEAVRGTNAIGTGIAMDAAVRVHGDEHFIRRHHRLSCSAAPVRAPDGRLLGVIDVSGPPERVPPDLLARVDAASAIATQQLFLAAHPHASIVALHPDAARLNLPQARLLAFDKDGALVGVSHGGPTLDPHWLNGLRTDGAQGMLRHLRRASAAGTRLAAPGVHARMVREPEPAPRVAVRHPDAVDAGPLPGPRPTRTRMAPDPLLGLDPRCADTARRLLDADIPVLLQGETGTGKELFARWLHAHGPLADRPFVAINCAAIPENLIEAELFGYEEGAFTGARRKGMPGRLAQADGGILFLDEIGDMPHGLQTRLLRVLQDRVIVPLGGGQARTANFRLICATHRDLEALAQTGLFRADLLYRINHFPIALPALRDRPALATIVDAVLARHGAGARRITLAPPLKAALRAYPWPGNLRQLDNLLSTLVALADDGATLDLHDLPTTLQTAMAGPEAAAAPDCATLIARHGGASAAARAMGWSRSTFYRRLRAERSAAAR